MKFTEFTISTTSGDVKIGELNSDIEISTETGKTTGTNKWGAEVAFDAGKIETAITKANNSVINRNNKTCAVVG